MAGQLGCRVEFLSHDERQIKITPIFRRFAEDTNTGLHHAPGWLRGIFKPLLPISPISSSTARRAQAQADRVTSYTRWRCVAQSPSSCTFAISSHAHRNSIVNSSVLHVSFAPNAEDPFPAILPMIGTMGSYEYLSAGFDEPLDCYLRGYVSSRIMRLATSSPQGLPASIAATKVDGLVLALTPNVHSYNYRSAITV
ncbi:hypothetical protein Z517_09340 [Fonsecaea pedrosoi CBS 271.37]|uniref:Uncharacterized protein n=1 Tax=Fonsecaea pedrosoi CBS 271.37 TaxID=1442368 RepID=A0A0D2DGT8_9EURO|nr:uncharacterized protein Z517_09340 [Fonsecaea pedrosoi CBS 271.37]KIW76896.1 hypothetical protein Z517_09340 [Fonsecaea pedrosoi CBS 271.37]